MIEYIKGDIAELTPAYVVIECGGIGYSLNISLSTYAFLEAKKSALLYVHEAIKEDAYQLYGFFDKPERSLFLLLVSVSGVGANTARMMLSSLSQEELRQAISTGNEQVIKSVKGIGLKTAQRVIVDLKDKIQQSVGDAPLAVSSPAKMLTSCVQEEAISALVMLGFAAPATQKAVAKIVAQHVDAKVEEVIKMALKLM